MLQKVKWSSSVEYSSGEVDMYLDLIKMQAQKRIYTNVRGLVVKGEPDVEL